MQNTREGDQEGVTLTQKTMFARKNNASNFMILTHADGSLGCQIQGGVSFFNDLKI